MTAYAPRIVVASNNDHKIREIGSILAACGLTDLELVPMSAFDLASPVEDGATFTDNALIKARVCAQATGLPALADDSGIVVDALDGRPGVHSARYAGLPGDDAANNERLLAELSDVALSDRTARFVAVVALVAADGRHTTVEGIMPGRVALAPQGTFGFGYDPLFIADVTSDGRTNGQLTAAEKDAISHRGAALRRLATDPLMIEIASR